MTSTGNAIDPVTLAVVDARLQAITMEMGNAMVHAARNPIFNQGHDFSCFLADGDGNVIAQADGLPIHTGSGGFATRGLLRHWPVERLRPGDAFLLNDPYEAGGNHLPDWTLIRPVFEDGQLLGFSAVRAHQADIGGGMMGTYNPDATEIYHEGLRLPPMKLVSAGEPRDDVFALLRLNCRLPEVMESDLLGMLGTSRVGERRLVELANEYGLEGLATYASALLDRAELALRSEIADIPDGEYFGSDSMNNTGQGEAYVSVRVRVVVKGSEITFDFTDSDPQVRGFKNSPLANTYAAVFVALLTLVDPNLPKNDGTFRPVKVLSTPGSIVDAIEPAAVTYATVSPTHEIVHAIWKALGPVIPERVSAGWGKPNHPISAVLDGAGGYVYYHWGAFPAGGAVKGGDGFEQLSTLNTLGGMTIPNVEVYERLYPLRIMGQEFAVDGGGPGEWRGGTGVRYEVEFSEPSELVLRGDGLRDPSGVGMSGGLPGAAGELELTQPDGSTFSPAQYGIVRVLAGTRLRVKSAGGGGWGDALSRDPELVLRDVRDGLVSRAAAERDYGVTVNRDGLVDAAATTTLRQRRRASQTQ